MILYCDTSALLKLYIAEPGADRVAEQAAACDVLAVNRIAWVEAHAALARRAREQPTAAAQFEAAKQRLADQWPDFLTLELTATLAGQAAHFADVFALRAYDSVQLASVHSLHLTMGGETTFACFDLRLTKAARVLGLTILA